MTTTMSAREFNQNLAKAKRAAASEGPVIVTDRGKPAYVLMAYVEYEATHAHGRDDRPLAERLAMDEEIDEETDKAFDALGEVLEQIHARSRTDFGRDVEW